MMKIIIKILIITFACTGIISADDTEQTQSTTNEVSTSSTVAQSTGDPTLDFFMGLQLCSPGVYQQKNSMSDTIGSEWLQQTVIGMSEEGCKVILSTPDSRTMYCNFTAQDMQTMRDEHFLKGIISDTVKDPSQDSINADMTWTELKNSSCTFTPFE